MNLVYEQLSLMVAQFHWLRPWWLLALIPVVLLSILLWQQKRHSYQWQQLIAAELLPYLMDSQTVGRRKSLLWVLVAAWCIGAIALAGPSWIKRPVPVEKNQNALVILLDLSISMVSEDVKPSRIVRARLKITDILRERKDGQTGLVVYAGDAHAVTPLSDDSATLVSLLPSLHPSIMPLQGSNTEAAVARGIQLFQDAGITHGDLLLITDGVVPEAFSQIQRQLENKKFRLNILGVGSSQPAPIASGKGGFVRDSQGAIVTTQLNSGELNQLAQQVNGRYSDIANTYSDITHLLSRDEGQKNNQDKVERDFDQWLDQGHWLVFLLLPVALVSFRRGFVLMLLCVPLLGLTPSSAYAFSVEDLWLTKDQQAQRALAAGDAKKAAEQFKSPDWKAAAQYRAGDYVAAAESYSKSGSASAHYNRGNALAKSGDLEGAIKAYNKALEREPNLEDAEKNRALVEALLKQQKQSSDKNQQDNKDQDSEDQDRQDQDNKDQNSQDQESKSQDSQNQNSQDQNKQDQNSKQQNKEAQEQQNQTGQQQPNGDSPNQQSQNSSAGESAQGQNSSEQSQNSSAANQAQGANQSSAATSTGAQPLTQNSAGDGSQQQAEQQAEASASDQLSAEQQQALEQWLRRVPDDPGGLLRNKFRWQYQQNRQKKADGEYMPPPNNADQRW